jgi:hypothetical protein
LLKESCGPLLTDSFKLNKPRRLSASSNILSRLRDRALRGQRLRALLKIKKKNQKIAREHSLKKKQAAHRVWMDQIDQTRERLRPREDDASAMKKRTEKLQDELQELREA